MLGLGLILDIPFAYIFATVFRNEKGLINGIKEVCALLYITLHKRGKRGRLDLYNLHERTENLKKIAIQIPNEEFELEYRRNLSKARKETEGVLFYGGDTGGNRLLVQIARGPNGLSSIWLSLKLDTGEEYTLPKDQLFVEPKTGPESFVGGGLRLKCLQPMRTWRISYNGLLKSKTENGEKLVHVKFGFLWLCSSTPQDVSADIHSKTWANFLAEESDWKGLISEMNDNVDRWIQVGNILGVVQVPEDNIEDREIIMWGGRRRHQDKESSGTKTKEFIIYFQNGECLHIGQVGLPSATKLLNYAFVMNSNAIGGPARHVKITNDPKGNLVIAYTRGPHTRLCVITKTSNALKLNNGDTLPTVSELSFVEAILDGDNLGHGVVLHNKGSAGKPLPLPKVQLPPMVKPKRKDWVLPLSNPDCRHSEVSGGKGSSLAQLIILSKEAQADGKFSVPRGLAVTTSAYENHLKETKMNEIIKPLENIAKENHSLLQESCKLAVAGFQLRPLTQGLKDSIVDNLRSVFGDNIDSLKFAVRSSASGEDSEELSAAGQMTTYLGVQGTQQIFDAVTKCWASQFSFVAIQYKRQNGQILNSPMAVVIQEMIPADVAGVMFTCDPVSGNPSQITITANYGIGESVVSAAAEPDTVIVLRNDSGLTGETKVDIGKKSLQIVLSGDGGVKEESISEELSSKSSLPIENATLLAEIGILIEESYGLPVDVEWGFHQGKLYLLQARPITTFDKESDFEIAHELDTPLRSEGEYTSMANVGEVMPGAFSYLGASTMNKIFELTSGWHLHHRGKYNWPSNPYFIRGMVRCQNHAMFGLFDTILRFYHGEPNMVTQSQMVSICGRLLEDDEMFKMAAKRNAFYPPNSVLKQSYYILGDMLFANSRVEDGKARKWNSKIVLPKNLGSKECHESLWKQYLDISTVTPVHVDCTMVTSFYNIFLLSILVSGNKGWGPNVFKDIAYVLSSCYDVESVDVPNAIEKLSESIAKSTNATSFKQMKPEDALQWLQTTSTKAGTHYKEFLNHHGHRCYKEFDIFSQPWGTNTLPLVKTLQDMTCTVEKKQKKEAMSILQTIKHLSVPLTWKQKLMLLFVIPLCRIGVGMRERSKSLMIKVIDHGRKAYNDLGELMAKEGRIPDKDLIFYFSLWEVDALIKNRSPTLIQKAIRRRAIHSTMDKLIFPEISKGLPKAINYGKRVYTKGSLTIKGIPVSNGIAEGLARVATSLDEATHIQPGEILIAYSTDIGWSPFFPMLAGVATELGGLVSHGAVVAREYGLPCVVSVHGATLQFKTGDRVLLNGNKGTLERLDDSPQ